MNSFDLINHYQIKHDNVMKRLLDKSGVSYNHFAVLYTLANSPNGQCTQKQVCEDFFLPKQSVFNVAKEYREKGWVEFQPSETDKREKIMCLTKVGKAEAEPVWAKTQAVFDKVLANFGEEKTAQLFALTTEFTEMALAELEKQEAKNTCIKS